MKKFCYSIKTLLFAPRSTWKYKEQQMVKLQVMKKSLHFTRNRLDKYKFMIDDSIKKRFPKCNFQNIKNRIRSF